MIDLVPRRRPTRPHERAIEEGPHCAPWRLRRPGPAESLKGSQGRAKVSDDRGPPRPSVVPARDPRASRRPLPRQRTSQRWRPSSRSAPNLDLEQRPSKKDQDLYDGSLDRRMDNPSTNDEAPAAADRAYSRFLEGSGGGEAGRSTFLDCTNLFRR